LRSLSFVGLVLHRIDPHFGAMVGASRNSQVETVEAFPALSEIPGGSGSYSGLNFGEKLVVIGVFLLEYADVAFAAADVHALAGGVVIQVVRVLDGRKRRDLVARVAVKHSQSRRHSGGDEEPVISLIQRHGKVALKGQRPAHYRVSIAIDDGDLLQVRQVHIDIWA
jgi:hypothetical protein